MRSGKLLAEESPHVLLSMYGCQSLEEVFLKLSRSQGQPNAAPIEMNISNNISLASLNWGKKDAISVTEESGVVGLNFHQSKEVLIHDASNGHLDVRLKFSVAIFRFRAREGDKSLFSRIVPFYFFRLSELPLNLSNFFPFARSNY